MLKIYLKSRNHWIRPAKPKWCESHVICGFRIIGTIGRYQEYGFHIEPGSVGASRIIQTASLTETGITGMSLP